MRSQKRLKTKAFLRNRLQRYYKYLKNTNYSVKKRQSYWLLLLFMLLCSTAQAKVSNYIGLYAQAGEWTLLPSQSNYNMSIGGEGGLGLIYELQAGPNYSQTQFLFDVGVGAWGGMTNFKQNAITHVELPGQIDLQGDEFTYIYDFQNRSDRYGNIAVQVPLLLGVQHKKFYLLAGAIINANVITKAHMSTELQTSGKYPAFGIMTGMPEYQFFDSYETRSTTPASLKMDLDFHLEAGGRIGYTGNIVGFGAPKNSVEYRLAGFIDYGLNDIHNSRDLSEITTPTRYDVTPSSPNYVYNSTSMVKDIQMNDILSTTGFASKVNNLMVGLKFTVLFRIHDSGGRCLICRDAYRGSGSRRSGGVKYEE